MFNLLAAPPKIGDLYRHQLNAKEWVLLIPAEILPDAVIARNVTAGGDLSYRFSTSEWSRLCLIGALSRQPWFNQLDL